MRDMALAEFVGEMARVIAYTLRYTDLQHSTIYSFGRETS